MLEEFLAFQAVVYLAIVLFHVACEGIGHSLGNPKVMVKGKSGKKLGAFAAYVQRNYHAVDRKTDPRWKGKERNTLIMQTLSRHYKKGEKGVYGPGINAYSKGKKRYVEKRKSISKKLKGMKKREPTGFALFVKHNYHAAADANYSGMSARARHAAIMKKLASAWHHRKSESATAFKASKAKTNRMFNHKAKEVPASVYKELFEGPKTKKRKIAGGARHSYFPYMYSGAHNYWSADPDFGEGLYL